MSRACPAPRRPSRSGLPRSCAPLRGGMRRPRAPAIWRCVAVRLCPARCFLRQPRAPDADSPCLMPPPFRAQLCEARSGGRLVPQGEGHRDGLCRASDPGDPRAGDRAWGGRRDQRRALRLARLAKAFRHGRLCPCRRPASCRGHPDAWGRQGLPGAALRIFLAVPRIASFSWRLAIPISMESQHQAEMCNVGA